MSCNKVLGNLFFSLDGQNYETVTGTGELMFGGAERKPLIGSSGKVFVTEELKEATLKVTFIATNTINRRALNQVCGVAATFEGDDGVVYQLQNVTAKGNGGVKAGEGKFELEFFGEMA